MKDSYKQARSDHEYLWSYSPAADMTGAYVDQEDLATMLANPTQATARKCYIRQICYWFQAGTEDGGNDEVEELLSNDVRVQEIYERYM